MKKIYYKIVCAICVICGFTSCADFLEIKPTDQILLDDFWNEKADVDNIMSGCYSALQGSDVRMRMMIWGEARSENVMGSGNIKTADVHLYNILQENITSMNTYTTWVGFYDVINRCNTVLKYAPGVAAKDPAFTEGDLKATIAEATALRSLCYFYLIRTFRDVPFSREAYTDDDQKMDLPATPFYEVLDNIISDLETVKGDAVKRYPETSTKVLYQTGRITQDAINAMLCEMYLWKGDYDQCVKCADLVIDSKKIMQKEEEEKATGLTSLNKAALEERLEGFPLVNDELTGKVFGTAFEELFVKRSFTSSSYPKESIFELVYSDQPSEKNMLANSAVTTLYGREGANGLLLASKVVKEDVDLTADRKIFEEKNKKADSRMWTNFDATKDDPPILKYSTSTMAVNASNVNTPTASFERYSSSNCASPWIIYRLADIMLLKAEALCEQMKDGVDAEAVAYNKELLDTAFQLVNVINKRSIMKEKLAAADMLQRKDYDTKIAMQNLVMRERQRELMFEGKRWYDLVRYCMRAERNGEADPTSTIISAVGNREDVNTGYAQNFFKKMDAIFWPYNLDEMKVNRNLVANPAFSSGENSSYDKTSK